MTMIWENVWTIIGSAAGYFFLTLMLPSVCLRKYTAEKELTFRFFFYQCIGNLYINFIVLLLGFLHLVHFISLLLLLVILPLSLTSWRERRRIMAFWRRSAKVLKELILGIYGFQVFFRKIRQKLLGWLIQKKRCLKGNVAEILIFSAVMAWIIWFYGWYKLHNTGYGHTDEETHLYWIGALIHGNLFPAGMYPHGVHTLNAALGTLFPMNVTRVYLNFSVLSTVMVFGSAYALFRKFFSNRYVAMAGWAFFVFTDLFHTTSYFRFQFSFPMEFGLVAAFGMVYAMLAYIKNKQKGELILFSACITWTLMAHFYITILCLVICVCFGLVFFIPILRKKVLLRFAAAGLAGVILACIPYVWGYLNGYEFERSIEWALGIAQTTAESENQEDADGGKAEAKSYNWREEDVLTLAENLLKDESKYLSYNYVNKRDTASMLMLADGALAVYALLGLIFSRQKIRYLGYLFWAVLWEAGAILACVYYLNLPALIEVKRMATFLTFLSIPLLGLPFEMLFTMLRLCRIKEKYLEMSFAILITGGIWAMSSAGRIKEERYYSITISEADMRVSLDLCENHEKYTWTVISPTNDLSVIRYDGYHYEIVDLLKDLDRGKKSIYIPTPEIYVVTERHPISFANDRREIDRSDIDAPDKVKAISPEMALQDIDWTEDSSGLHGADAPYYYQRDVVMSKLHYWMEAVKQIYPNHVWEYYSDETVTVFKISQDPYFTLNLSVDYKKLAEEEVGGKE